jgi:regulator of protease activity HflC (stomatin/prohibitin superfamily)
VIAIESVNAAISQISQTTVRNVVGQFSLDQLLSQTLAINAKIKDVIDGHTEPWGAQVTAVEIKDITLPDNMQRAMAKEAEAERERPRSSLVKRRISSLSIRSRCSYGRCKRWPRSASRRIPRLSSPRNS